MRAVHEPDIGEYVKETGAVIPHIMRDGFIGRKVLYDVSTQSMRCYQCGVLEEILDDFYWHTRPDGEDEKVPCDRVVIYHGKKQRALISLMPGRNIFECLPWDAYPERAKAWKQSTFTPVQLSLF